jgi:hypothetical protein
MLPSEMIFIYLAGLWFAFGMATGYVVLQVLRGVVQWVLMR